MTTISYPAQVVTTPVTATRGTLSICVPDLERPPFGILVVQASGNTVDAVKALAGKAVTKVLADYAKRSLPPPVPSALETIPQFRPPTGCVEVARFMVTADLPAFVEYEFHAALRTEVAQKVSDQFRKQVIAFIQELSAKMSR